eukprot:TRINITY_DN14249_c0_g1_i3.p2 TRINITY_DN14249_c0_g1~~TRINITY_DN14249_c0_g1_i3.p2  ORF type:complete len:266 (+),score=46.03 TRINITY_DN14249_c0_g1_i3:79-798(+)
MCPAAGAVQGLCEVRSSRQPGGGQGVFLLRGVPAGTVVTLFAGRVREEGEHLRLRRAGDPLASYTLSLGGGQVLIPPAPGQWADGEMGHKVNDAAAVLLPSNLRELSDGALADCLAAGFASYVSTLGATPCEFAPASEAAKDPAIGDRHLIAVVAKRPMEAGAEVLASYGLGYWVHRRMPTPRRGHPASGSSSGGSSALRRRAPSGRRRRSSRVLHAAAGFTSDWCVCRSRPQSRRGAA